MPPLILIADDDPSMLNLLGTFFRGKGFEVFAVQDGMQAGIKAVELRPALIILDYEMPAAPGDVVYERLRGSLYTTNTPIIFVTGNLAGLSKKGLTTGERVRFFRKPVDLRELERAVCEMLGPSAPAKAPQPLPAPAAPPATSATPIPKPLPHPGAPPPAAAPTPKPLLPPANAAPTPKPAPLSAPAPRFALPPVSWPTPRPAGARILVVDDDANFSSWVQVALKGAGYETTAAASAEAALSSFKAAMPDLVILDLDLGGTSGLSVCREMRALLGERHVPIVVLTGRTDSQSVLYSLEAGADEFLNKPCKVQELLARVRSMLRLKAAVDKLRKANAFKSELLAIASHDLLTPLSVIRCYAEVLLSAEFPATEEKRRLYLANIQKGSDNMHDIVKRFLQQSRLESEDLKPALVRLDPAALVSAGVEAVRMLAEQKGIRLSLENRLPSGYTIAADTNLLAEIVQNLLANAIKFTPAKGAVTAALACSPGCFTLSVSDTGPGISQDQQAAIFEKFRRATGVQKSEGVGYGLAIVKRFAELHGGGVGISSLPGQGSTFKLSLPQPQAA